MRPLEVVGVTAQAAFAARAGKETFNARIRVATNEAAIPPAILREGLLGTLNFMALPN
jgi:hypothetical protein